MHDLKLATASRAVQAHVDNMNADAWPLPLAASRQNLEGSGGTRHALDWRRRSPNWAAFARTLTQLELGYDESKRILWQYMLPTERPRCRRPTSKEMEERL